MLYLATTCRFHEGRIETAALGMRLGERVEDEVAGFDLLTNEREAQPDFARAKAARAASSVAAMSSSSCAVDMKPASNADGAR